MFVQLSLFSRLCLNNITYVYLLKLCTYICCLVHVQAIAPLVQVIHSSYSASLMNPTTIKLCTNRTKEIKHLSRWVSEHDWAIVTP